MTSTLTPTPTLDPATPHRFQRSVEKAWTCVCGKNHKARVHHDGVDPAPRRTRQQAAPSAGTVAAAHVEPGQVVYTTEPDGTDFGLPLVSPVKRGGVARTVRSHLRESGGVVVRFTDGCKTRPIHGRSVLVLVPAVQS